ncbi:MAG: UvrD-helicase domain-containing protein [Rickettsiales bacterium]|nr:UvrD-helicase domain-containing protein [Rickettsiales bacterium]
MDKLNDRQQEAVKTTDGAVLVLSGAGTGKTTVIISRISHILQTGLARPWEILALTFTNKAANEMKERLLPSVFDWCGTFHSICLKILRRESERKNFLVFGEDEQKAVLKTVFAAMNLDNKDYDPGTWVEKIALFKDTGRKNDSKKFNEILAAYNAELQRLNAIDFADIINHANALLAENAAVREKYQKQFRYILVDEFQDTNPPQYQLVKTLAAGYGNICCVGDDDQSIYSWRGAEIQNILNFEKDFPGAKIVRLEINYRSTGNILLAANKLIKNNNGRLGKELQTTSAAGNLINIRGFNSDLEESSYIADNISEPKNTAILIRSGSLSKRFEDEFLRRGVSYKLVGAQKFYDRMEIRDAIAYIRLLVYRFDDLSLLRIIGKPRRGFGDKAIADLRRARIPLFDAVMAHKNGPLFTDAFDFDWRELPPAAAALKILEDSGYIKYWQESKDDAAPDRIKNIHELINGTIAKYNTLPEFIENASLMIADDIQDDAMTKEAVSIMTIHAAKGLEFDTVFLPAWEEDIFPNKMSVEEGNLEEERRLAYVAITRARKNLTISHAYSRMQYGQFQNNMPSRFISELGAGIKSEKLKVKSEKIGNTLPPMIGKMVRHNELGDGVVIAIDENILTIAFKKSGIKKVEKSFITLA